MMQHEQRAFFCSCITRGVNRTTSRSIRLLVRNGTTTMNQTSNDCCR